MRKSKSCLKKPNGTQKNTAPSDGTKSQNNNENKTETESIKEQLKRAQDKLNKMQPVANINVSKDFFSMSKTEKQNWIIEKLQPTNYQVNRKGIGIISFAKKHLKSAFNYFVKGGADEASFEALPAVLTNGIEIANRSEHKERGYGTITIAAPIIINSKRGNMAIVVKKTDGNNYKVHRVLAPDGTVFQIKDATREAESTPAGESPNNGSLATPINSASDDSLTRDN